MNQIDDNTERQVDDWLRDWSTKSPSSMNRETANQVRIRATRLASTKTRNTVLVLAFCFACLGLYGLTQFTNQIEPSLPQEDRPSLLGIQTRIEEIQFELLKAKLAMLTQTLNQMEIDGDHDRRELACESVKHQLKSDWLAQVKIQEPSSFLQLP